jgi:hypothetical protein
MVRTLDINGLDACDINGMPPRTAEHWLFPQDFSVGLGGGDAAAIG